jgi:rhamnosyltransferase
MEVVRGPVAGRAAVSGMGGPTADTVVAVVVTLQPDVDVVEHIETLVGRVLRIVVIDNGSGPEAASILDSISRLPSVELIRNPVNSGIARALNQGVEAAIGLGAIWLLTLDQDAAPGPDIVGIAGQTFETYPQPRRIAVIGSTSTGDLALPTRSASRGRPWIETNAVITAGSFVSLPVLRHIGGFREDFFIDYVDIEFCLRARAKGYRIVVSPTPGMTHKIGQPTLRWIGPRAVTPTNHPAARRYYITRNRFIVWRRYCRTDPGYIARDMLASQRELVKLLLFEENRVEKLRSMIAGMVDGSRGVTGRRKGSSAALPPVRGQGRPTS